VKLGLRYVCVTKDGRFAGVVSCPACLVGYNALTISQTHKKTFVRYMRDLEEKEVDH